ncbi:hypothetical protein [Microbulbifer sp. JTAC008]|uniref:hypothetical protein n=1 Tax=Microbulbifer sp. JTAC008 TaxID=3243374 RepID=UPI004039953D
MNIQTGEWCDDAMVSVTYDFEITVGKNSGEDGALAPSCSLCFLSEDEREIKHLPLVKNSKPYCFNLQKPSSWDAFWGNDFWDLENNRMTVKSFDGKSAEFCWEAEYGEVEGRHTFLFEGLVHFDHILVRAHTEGDIEAAISQTWSPEFLRDQLLLVNKKIDPELSQENWLAKYKLLENSA